MDWFITFITHSKWRWRPFSHGFCGPSKLASCVLAEDPVVLRENAGRENAQMSLTGRSDNATSTREIQFLMLKSHQIATNLWWVHRIFKAREVIVLPLPWPWASLEVSHSNASQGWPRLASKIWTQASRGYLGQGNQQVKTPPCWILALWKMKEKPKLEPCIRNRTSKYGTIVPAMHNQRWRASQLLAMHAHLDS